MQANQISRRPREIINGREKMDTEETAGSVRESQPRATDHGFSRASVMERHP